MSVGVIFAVFGLVAVAELPDKTMIATLVMGSRGHPAWVWGGASVAFLLHVSLAVGAGRLIELLPHRPLEIVVTALFFMGAVVLLAVPERRAAARGEREAQREGKETTDEAAAQAAASPADTAAAPAPSEGPTGTDTARRAMFRVAASAFAVIAVGEFGDLTQLLTVSLVGRYHQPWSVFVGALLALVLMAGLGAFGGRALLRVLPLEWIRRGGGIVLLGFAAYGIYSLVR